MKLRELVKLDSEFKREVTAYAESEGIVLEQLLELSLSEWLKSLAEKVNLVAEAIANV